MAVPAENLSVLLSREELVFLLYILKADFIPGLDPDPVGEPTKEQKNLSLAHAERALRARDLVSVNEKGELVVRETLLLMVGTCAYPELMISLHHFPSKNPPSRVFWHARSGVIVAHTRPEAPLHGLTLLKNRETLHQQVVENCALTSTEKSNLPEVITTNLALKAARETAAKDLRVAIQGLIASGAFAASAEELGKILAGEHAVSALHLAAQKADQTTAQESVTVLSGPTSTWLMTNGEQDQVLLKATNPDELFGLVLHWTGLVGNWPEIPTVS